MVRRSRKKRSSREDYPTREQLKIEEGVFENRTMLRLGKLFSKRIVSRLEFITARGKEADVYIASGGDSVDADYVIVKIFRLETAAFQKRINYVLGDPRFGKIKKSPFAVVSEWCKKEYGNLMLAESAGAHVPKAYAFSGNVLAMEFIGDEATGTPSDMLKDVKLKDPDAVLGQILDDVKKLYSCELVHGDLSEYNVLMKEGTPYMIDLGQGVLLEHPEAMSFLRRDLHNIISYFAKTYGTASDEDGAFARVTDQESMRRN
jgi:RIO kinase 1